MSLKEEYRRAISAQENLGSLSIRQDSEEYQAALAQVIAALQQCQRQVQSLAMFSDNESMDDLVTNDIQYLDIPFRLGNVYEKVRRDGVDRLDSLNKSVSHYIEFLQSLNSYKILTKNLSQKLKDATSDGGLKLQRLQSTDASTRRQEKIDNFKLEKALEQKLKSNTISSDEDEVRIIRIAELGLKILRTFNNLETMSMELHMLKNMPSAEQLQEIRDSRQRDRETSQYQPGKIDQPRNSGPLMDKHGKVQRPFTIVNSRDQIKKQVFGTGQYLPTMTVEEFIDEEFKSGRVLKGGEDSRKQEESDEDDEAKADEKTYKARDWDEFVEANPKGWGNTMNRG